MEKTDSYENLPEARCSSLRPGPVTLSYEPVEQSKIEALNRSCFDKISAIGFVSGAPTITDRFVKTESA